MSWWKKMVGDVCSMHRPCLSESFSQAYLQALNVEEQKMTDFQCKRECKLSREIACKRWIKDRKTRLSTSPSESQQRLWRSSSHASASLSSLVAEPSLPSILAGTSLNSIVAADSSLSSIVADTSNKISPCLPVCL